MGWLSYTLLLVCCFGIRADKAPDWEELNELSQKLEKRETDLSTADRLDRIEKLVNLQQKNVYDVLVNQELSKREPTSTPSSKNCQDILNTGGSTSGVYSIYPDGKEEVQVFCEQELQGGGWTVFQRRMDGSVDFYRVWDEYKRGFGSVAGEYWIGNDHLHHFTANQDTQLLVELEYGGETQYAKYTEFWVQNEHANYTLHVSGYSGGSVPGDSLQHANPYQNHNGQPFTTRDHDNDNWGGENCAGGGWWYNSCYGANLNGRYNSEYGGIYWMTWKGHTSLSGVRMMIKTT